MASDDLSEMVQANQDAGLYEPPFDNPMVKDKELRESVERYKAGDWTDGKPREKWEAYQLSAQREIDLERIADAYIALEDKRRRDEVDDALPVTDERLDALMSTFDGDVDAGACGNMCKSPFVQHIDSSGEWRQINLPIDATMGDVRRLLSALQIATREKRELSRER